MAQVIFTRRALNDLLRLRQFIHQKNPQAAQHAAQRIITSIDQLQQFPYLGKASDDMPEGFHELMINFGRDGYVALYEISLGTVTVVAIRHQREAGF